MSGILILIGIVTVLVLVCLSRRNSQSQTPRRLQAKQPRNSRTAKNAASRGSRNNAATNMNELDYIKSNHKGVAVIIGNNYRQKTRIKGYKQLQPLDGPHNDVELMKETFKYLKFFTIVKLDVTEDELISILYTLANHPYPKSCRRFILTYSGHGGDGFIYSEDEKRVNISKIVEALTPNSGNDSLTGIPRLFFFDTCRGDLYDQGITARGGVENWQSKVPSTGDVLVAYATTAGYKAFEQVGGGLWTRILAKKLVTSSKSIYDTLTEVNEELIAKIRAMQGPTFQQPELVGRLNKPIHLLQESGQLPKEQADTVQHPSYLPVGKGKNSNYKQHGNSKSSTKPELEKRSHESSTNSFSKSQMNSTRNQRQNTEEDMGQQALCERKQLQKVPPNQYKQLLKERYCDEWQLSSPQYTTESASEGFVSTVKIPQYKSVRGPVGNSKKEAEQLAAMEALR